MRLGLPVAALAALAGCDTLFSIERPDDAAPDSVVADAAPLSCESDTTLHLCIDFERIAVNIALDTSTYANDATVDDVDFIERGAEQAAQMKPNGFIRIDMENELGLAGPMTYAMWLKIDPTSTGLVVALDNDSQYAVVFDSATDRPSCTVTLRGGTATAATEAPTISRDVWHHIACVKRSDTLAIYVDGVLNGSNPAPDELHQFDPDNLMIGGNAPGPTDRLIGALDDVVIANRELTLAEIQRLATP